MVRSLHKELPKQFTGIPYKAGTYVYYINDNGHSLLRMNVSAA